MDDMKEFDRDKLQRYLQDELEIQVEEGQEIHEILNLYRQVLRINSTLMGELHRRSRERTEGSVR